MQRNIVNQGLTYIFVSLNLTALVFEELKKGWFNGSMRIIHGIVFHHCIIRKLQASAFKKDGGSRRTQSFVNLLNLSFEETHIEEIERDFLAPAHRYLHHFAFTNFPDHANLTDIFGQNKLNGLRFVACAGKISNYTRTITAANFRGLTNIQLLTLICCGIEDIEADAFDFIGRTLTQLRLGGNKLKPFKCDGLLLFWIRFMIVTNTLR